MGNLRDQLKNANLLSKKDAKRLAHEERVTKKQKGRAQLEQEQEQRAADLRAKQEADRRSDREREAARQEDQKQLAEQAAVRDLLTHKAWAPGPGTVRYFFEASDGTVPYLECSAQELRRLSSGELAIVRGGAIGAHVYRLVEIADARRVRTAMPEQLAWAPSSL